MAKYSDIKGFTVQTLSTDTVASQQAGGTWSSGGEAGGAIPVINDPDNEGWPPDAGNSDYYRAHNNGMSLRPNSLMRS